MANTLNLGDGNWGVKDSSLLGYAKDNTKFVPETFDVTRASGGTRVNKDGFIDTPTEIGSELITNGSFATDSDWTLQSSWNISGGVATYDGVVNSHYIEQGLVFISGKEYKFTFTISGGSGASRLGFYSDNNIIVSILPYANGTHTVYGTTGTVGSNLRIFAASVGGSFSIDNISVVEINQDNLARIDYSDGVDGVLLTEPQSTNLITDSEDFSDSSWTNVGVTVASNTTISPDGTQNADTLSILSGDFFYKQITGTGTFTISCYVKVASGSLDFRMQSFNSTDGNDLSSVFVATTEWQRFEFTSTVTANSGFYPIIINELLGGDFEVWGVQVEELPYATSYIPTYGAIASRSGDLVTNGGDVNNFNSESGVLFVEIAALADGGENRRISLSDGTNDNRVVIYHNTTNKLLVLVKVGGVTSFAYTMATDIKQSSKIGLKWKQDDFALWVNGTEVEAVTSGNTFAADTLDTLAFTDGSTGTLPFYGKTKNIQVFNEALSDAELQTLTTI